MPSAWMIGSLVIKSDLVVLIGSFIVGFLFFWFMSPHSKMETKKWIEEASNLLVVFVITLWIGKIFTNLHSFISDPISILAYLSDSKAFYIAVLLTVIFESYRKTKRDKQVIDLLYTFLNIFFTASFTYEFIQVISRSEISWQYLGLLVLIIIIFIMKQEIWARETLVFIGLLCWSGGLWFLSIFSSTMVFQFNLDHWFYVVIFLTSILLLIFRKRVN
ncbi:hypothetical protein [Gracilibacillus dipsosauri]|uniref:Uncharacterized protein n=1 Tax=Gracilibacillus dipsosauri TaxID=178340 RepID=A0A317KVX7_9BACI|nr:hypothetical protein [Gracilibacillus dipsosauri]PWU67661.1 hypothetical protein DLJ74_14485 [Gracilibacillus dipsosauri]